MEKTCRSEDDSLVKKFKFGKTQNVHHCAHKSTGPIINKAKQFKISGSHGGKQDDCLPGRCAV
jgi:hypothetical protein